MTNKQSQTIIDTHILIWSLIEKDKLTQNEITSISQAQLDGLLLISSISLWEIAMLVNKKKINVFARVVDFLADIENLHGIQIIQIDSKIASESISFTNNFHGDPADRMIVATAKVHSANLITRDQKIIQWARNGEIRINQF
jgi:PIN domain nuclease of toxin-antitoxin system